MSKRALENQDTVEIRDGSLVGAADSLFKFEKVAQHLSVKVTNPKTGAFDLSTPESRLAQAINQELREEAALEAAQEKRRKRLEKRYGK